MQTIYRIGVRVDDKSFAVFALRAISQTEEARYRERFAQISDTETPERKLELENEIYVESLSSWITQAPVLRTESEAGAAIEKPLVDDADTPETAVKKFFENNKDAGTERFPLYLAATYMQKLTPEIRFF